MKAKSIKEDINFNYPISQKDRLNRNQKMKNYAYGIQSEFKRLGFDIDSTNIKDGFLIIYFGEKERITDDNPDIKRILSDLNINKWTTFKNKNENYKLICNLRDVEIALTENIGGGGGAGYAVWGGGAGRSFGNPSGGAKFGGRGFGFGSSGNLTGGPNLMYTYDVKPLTQDLQQKPTPQDGEEVIHTGSVIKGNILNNGKEIEGQITHIEQDGDNNILWYTVIDDEQRIQKVDPTSIYLINPEESEFIDMIDPFDEIEDQREMKTVDESLNESPDNIPGTTYGYESLDSYPFGSSQQGNVFIGPEGQSHAKIDKIEDFPYHQGRIWVKHQFISFWEAPSKKELINILNQLELKFDDVYTFSIEIKDDDEEWNIYTLDFYPDNIKNNISINRSDHVKSPLNKKIKKLPKGLGSNKLLPIQQRFKMHQYENFYPNI